MAEITVAIENVTKVYPGKGAQVLALDDVSLNVREKEFLAILGPSGCGKTTLMRMVAGLIPYSSGRIMVAGQEVKGPIPQVGIVFQKPVLLPWRSVLENVLLPIEFLKQSPSQHRQRAMELLSLVGLEGFADKAPQQLSGGMQQRACISRALMHDPDILLMDEPFGALDALTRDTMNYELLQIWEERKKTIIFVTHSIPEAVFLADRVVVMSARPGRVAAVLDIDLPRPRRGSDRYRPEFGSYVARAGQALGLTEEVAH